MSELWTNRAIRDFADRIREINSAGEELEPLSVTKDLGVVLQSTRFKKRIATNLKKYQIAKRGEFVFDPMSMYYGGIGRLDVTGRGAVSPDYVVFGVDSSVDSDFLLYLLRSEKMRARYESLSERGNRFGKRRRLYWSAFRDIEVTLPPLWEQRKIAAILSAADELIEETEAVIEQLQVVKKAMMQELLTRGLPGRHTRFKNTEIGKIPEAWEVATIGHYCRLISGGTPKRSMPQYWNGNIPWVRTGEINYRLITSTSETISRAGLENSSAKLLPAGTVVMAMYGQGATRGRAAILGIEAATNQACLAFLPHQSLKPRFLYHWLCWSYARLRGIGHEGTQKNLSATIMGSLLISIPSVEEQDAIIALLDANDDMRIQTLSEGEVLRQLKQSLMYILLTGEVRVTPDEAPP